MVRIFLSHNSRDKRFVRELTTDLRRYGAYVWVDEAEIGIGDSLLAVISKAISQSDFVGAVISKNSVSSQWVQKELALAMTQEIQSGITKVLPIVIDDCELPIYLIDKLYADFRDPNQYHNALKAIFERIGLYRIPERDRSGVLVIYTGGGIGMIGERVDGQWQGLRPHRLENMLSGIKWHEPLEYRVDYQTIAHPKDSANMTFEDWTSLARLIAVRYNEYEGFIILHGFDTVGYFLSYLSFLVSGLNKSIIVTGSRYPAGSKESRGEENLKNGIILAVSKSRNIPLPPRIYLLRNGFLHHPCRILFGSADEGWLPQPGTERSQVVVASFDGKTLNLDKPVVKTIHSEEFHLTELDRHVNVHVQVYLPSLQPVTAFLVNMQQKFGFPAIVIVAMGCTARSILDDKGSMAILGKLRKAGVIIAIVEQWPGVLHGDTPFVDKTKNGIVASNAITVAAAVSKLRVLLGRNISLAEVIELFRKDLRGEYMLEGTGY